MGIDSHSYRDQDAPQSESAVWRTRKAGGVIPSESKDLETKPQARSSASWGQENKAIPAQ